MGALRNIVQTQYHPDENEHFYRTLEVALVSGDEYVSSVLRDDLVEILRDIREASRESPLSAIEEFQQKVQSVIEAKGSSEERPLR